MADAGRIVMACVVGLTVVAAERRPHAQDTRDDRPRADMSVAVRIDNNAVVPEDILKYAKAYATDVYQRIGVRIAWLDRSDAVVENAPPRYAVVLMTPQAANRKAQEDGITDEVVGQAVVTARRAYVYYDRIVAMALPPDRDLVTFLGYVIAHELGHLILATRGHSFTGIMRPHFGLRSRALETFTAQQAAAIRQRLRDDVKAGTIGPGISSSAHSG